MKQHSLTENKGLSLSQAQSISNLCHQRAIEIEAKFAGVNNVSKTVKVDGDDKTTIEGVALPPNVLELLNEKAKLHACQAFLMENMKAKELMLKTARVEVPDLLDVDYPDKPKFIDPVVKMLSEATEKGWGWDQLTATELNKFFEAESYAAHIGRFIHQDGLLTHLRAELPNIPSIEWMVIKDGQKSPVTIKKHHTSAELLKLHEELAAVHREKEQVVNYFKAKVKNLVTKENARIAKHNADLQNEAEKHNNDLQAVYETAVKKANEVEKSIRAGFETERQAKIQKIAGMRIDIDARFQETITEFLVTTPEKPE